MTKKTSKQKVVLLPEKQQLKPIKNIWIYVLILVVGVGMTFWRDAVFDENKERAKFEEKQLKAKRQAILYQEKVDKEGKMRRDAKMPSYKAGNKY